MASDDLCLECLRRSVGSWRRGLFDRQDTVAIMAWAIDIHIRREAPEEREREIRNPKAVPDLVLSEPLSADDQALWSSMPRPPRSGQRDTVTSG